MWSLCGQLCLFAACGPCVDNVGNWHSSVDPSSFTLPFDFRGGRRRGRGMAGQPVPSSCIRESHTARTLAVLQHPHPGIKGVWRQTHSVQDVPLGEACGVQKIADDDHQSPLLSPREAGPTGGPLDVLHVQQLIQQLHKGPALRLAGRQTCRARRWAPRWSNDSSLTSTLACFLRRGHSARPLERGGDGDASPSLPARTTMPLDAASSRSPTASLSRASSLLDRDLVLRGRPSLPLLLSPPCR